MRGYVSRSPFSVFLFVLLQPPCNLQCHSRVCLHHPPFCLSLTFPLKLNCYARGWATFPVLQPRGPSGSYAMRFLKAIGTSKCSELRARRPTPSLSHTWRAPSRQRHESCQARTRKRNGKVCARQGRAEQRLVSCRTRRRQNGGAVPCRARTRKKERHGTRTIGIGRANNRSCGLPRIDMIVTFQTIKSRRQRKLFHGPLTVPRRNERQKCSYTAAESWQGTVGDMAVDLAGNLNKTKQI